VYLVLVPCALHRASYERQFVNTSGKSVGRLQRRQGGGASLVFHAGIVRDAVNVLLCFDYLNIRT
jgi:hypothetical protein